MNESAKIENAKAVAISFLRAGNPQNEAFFLAFNESPSLVADFTSDYAKIESSLTGIQIEGGTALYDAMAAIAMRNQIKLRCAGSKIEIYVNNLRLDTLKDDSQKRGSVSLVFSGESGMFDDLAVKKLNLTSDARSGR